MQPEATIPPPPTTTTNDSTVQFDAKRKAIEELKSIRIVFSLAEQWSTDVFFLYTT